MFFSHDRLNDPCRSMRTSYDLFCVLTGSNYNRRRYQYVQYGASKTNRSIYHHSAIKSFMPARFRNCVLVDCVHTFHADIAHHNNIIVCVWDNYVALRLRFGPDNQVKGTFV